MQQTPLQHQTSNTISVAPAKRSPLGLLLGLAALFGFLFVLFIVLLVVMLVQDNGRNPLLAAFGIEPALLQTLLSVVVNLSFGVLSLVAFVVLMVGIFRRLTSTKTEVQKKRFSLILMVSGFISLGFLLAVWVSLYYFISQLRVGQLGAKEIFSDPSNLTNLTAPVEIFFSGQLLEQLYRREGIVSYSWDLDSDGEYDDGNNRDIQYSYTGTGNPDGLYTVGLKVILQTGEEIFTTKQLSISNVAPEPIISLENTKIDVPGTVELDASASSDLNGTIIAYEWDLNSDGEIDSTSPQASITAQNPGQQTVTLTVMDNNGEKRSVSKDVQFVLPEPERAVIQVTPSETGVVPFSARFTVSESTISEPIASYEWDFGDGSDKVKGKTIQHVYTKAGEYTVKVVLKGRDGGRYEQTTALLVKRSNSAPEARITTSPLAAVNGVITGDAPLKIRFDASDSRDVDNDIIEYQWDFNGDGETDAFGETVEKMFLQEGTQNVLLRVIDSAQLESQTNLQVRVNIPEIAVVLAVEPQSGPAPLEVVLDASASKAKEGNIIAYEWDFGDGSASVKGKATQIHVFPQVGEYTVTVSAISNAGKRGKAQALVLVREVELQADFRFNPQSVYAGETVFFDGSQSQGQISTYYWSFGEGSISRIVKPEHVFKQAGEYTVELEIMDRKNRISRTSQTLTVLAPRS